MTNAEFHLVSNWRVRGRIEEVYDIISEPGEFVRWWPEVYLDVKEVEPGDEDGVGRTLDLHTRGLLPYTLDWRAKATEVDKPVRLVVEARGDLQGRGEWDLRQEGEWTEVRYDWKVHADKPWMRRLAPLLKPVFAANHHWAMKKGRQGLERELGRLRKERRET